MEVGGGGVESILYAHNLGLAMISVVNHKQTSRLKLQRVELIMLRRTTLSAYRFKH